MTHLSPAHHQAFLRILSAALLLVLVLAGCGLLDETGGESAAPPARLTPTSHPTYDPATPTLGPQPDWRTDVEADGGFRIDVPGVLSPLHEVFINNASGKSISWTYVGVPLASSLQRVMVQTSLIMRYSSQILSDNLCPSASATPITLGSGIQAWQETDVPPHANGAPETFGYVRVSLTLNGEAIQITLEGPAPVDTFFTRYGAIWSHMLASFAQLPTQPVNHSRPCG